MSEADGNVRAPARGDGGGVRRRTRRRRGARNGEEEECEGGEGEETVPVPYLWGGGDSGTVSDFPAHDLHDRRWDLFGAAGHVALSGAPVPATPRATRPQRLDSRSDAAPRRGNPSDAVRAQRHSSAPLHRRDVGWALAQCLEFIGRSTVEIHWHGTIRSQASPPG